MTKANNANICTIMSQVLDINAPELERMSERISETLSEMVLGDVGFPTFLLIRD